MRLHEQLTLFLRTSSKFLVSPALLPARELVENYDRTLFEPMQVAIIGKIKASKSTLVNALLETPNLVQTGDLEVTYNVSWLKFSELDNAPIKVHFKDDSPPKLIERDVWECWANAQGKEVIKNNIAYMEVPCKHQKLKSLNIIDTPGLLSGGVDAENTIGFLADVRHKPDAVVVLFADSLHVEVAEVIRQFQKEGLGLTPINTIGVLSKIDKNWSPKDPVGKPMADALRACCRIREDAQTKGFFYDIMPINALLSVASVSIQDSDIGLLSRLASLPEKEIQRSLADENNFIRNDGVLSGVLTPEQKRGLNVKFARYGIFLLSSYLRDHPSATAEEVQDYLRETSGFESLNKVLNYHFGERAGLIKIRSAMTGLLGGMANIHDTLKEAGDLGSCQILEGVLTEVKHILANAHDYKEFEVLIQLYDKKIDHMGMYLGVSQEELEDEILHITGEFGLSYITKLDAPAEASVSDMKKAAKEKISLWNERVYVLDMVAREYKDVAKIIQESYIRIANEMDETKSKYDELSKLLYNH